MMHRMMHLFGRGSNTLPVSEDIISKIPIIFNIHVPTFTYTERLKSTNCMELCQVSLGRRWIRKSNKLTKNQGNPNGTPRYDKLYFGKFCCVKDEETHCGRNYQTIVKVALNFTKNKQIILER